MTVITEARNTTLADAKTILDLQAELRHDVVSSTTAIRMENGRLIIPGQGSSVELTADAVITSDLVLDCTDRFDAGLAARLNIPRDYFRTMRETYTDLLDINVNGWLNHASFAGRQFMVRSFREGDGGQARAVLSDRYGILDNLDFLTAAAQGIQRAGKSGDQVTRVNLSDDFFRFDVVDPDIQVLAPALLDGYRSPFSGQPGSELPIVRGFVRCSNSEVGAGKTKVEPGVEFLVCTNGQTVTKWAQDISFSKVHRGGKLGAGVVEFSRGTVAAQMEALSGQITDCMEHFLSRNWLQHVVDEMTRQAGKDVPANKGEAVIKVVGDKLHFTKTEREGILDMFMKGAQPTAGGVMQAITAQAQVVTAPDRAAHLESKALDALDVVNAMGSLV